MGSKALFTLLAASMVFVLGGFTFDNSGTATIQVKNMSYEITNGIKGLDLEGNRGKILEMWLPISL